MLVEARDRNGLFRSKLPFGDSLPAFLIAAPETSHAPFAFLLGGYSWWANLTNAYDKARIKSIAIRTHTSMRAHWSAPIKLASRQPADTNTMTIRYESCSALPYQWLSMLSSVCGLAPGKVLGSTKITHQRLTAIGQSIIATIRALTIHGTDCGMKPARRIPRTMLLARPWIKAVVSAGIEREPKRTVPNDLGRTLTVALPLFSSFMGFFFDKLKSGPVDLNEHQNNVKQALRQVNLTPIILVLFTKRLLSPHWQWISRLFSVLRSLRNQAVGGKPFTAISKKTYRSKRIWEHLCSLLL